HLVTEAKCFGTGLRITVVNVYKRCALRNRQLKRLTSANPAVDSICRELAATTSATDGVDFIVHRNTSWLAVGILGLNRDRLTWLADVSILRISNHLQPSWSLSDSALARF